MTLSFIDIDNYIVINMKTRYFIMFVCFWSSQTVKKDNKQFALVS